MSVQVKLQNVLHEIGLLRNIARINVHLVVADCSTVRVNFRDLEISVTLDLFPCLIDKVKAVQSIARFISMHLASKKIQIFFINNR